jgi:hypothetical protein
VRAIQDVFSRFGGHPQSLPAHKVRAGSGRLASPELKELYERLLQYDSRLIKLHTEEILLFDRFILIRLGSRDRDDFTESVVVEPLSSGGYRVAVREHESSAGRDRSVYKDIATAYGVVLFIELAISEYLAATEIQDPSEPQIGVLSGMPES